MVVTQLQLKWPNHSTHLLTGLKYLFKNEQLVDCTLKCNKHTLKVHRAVLAACSPYFERELENNSLIVIKDMQFNVLQALIEFMYYGETRITEENLTLLIEAAKLFEVKGLSEMDLLTSNDNGVISSTVAKNKNCTVESSCISNNIIDDMVFDNNSQLINSVQKSQIHEAIPNNVAESYIHDSEDSNSIIIADTANTEPHSVRNFVVTPPQTESAQILLSLARSYSQKQYLNSQSDDAFPDDDLLHGKQVVDDNINGNILFHKDDFLMTTTTTNDLTTSSSSSNFANVVKSSPSLPLEQQITNQSLPQQQHKDERNSSSLLSKYSLLEKYSDDEFASSIPPPNLTLVDNHKSILAKLLTKDTQLEPLKNFRNLYDEKDSENAANNQNSTDVVALDKSKNFELQARVILEYPFLIETNDGSYVSVDNMLNVFEGDEIFDSNGGKTLKIIPKEDVVISPMASCAMPAETSSAENEIDSYSEDVLERIKQDTEDELKDDPEAVVLSRVTDDGRLEKYVLSSADIEALKKMNELRKEQSQQRPGAVQVSHIEVESPLSNGDASLITRIIDCGVRVENAISKLPFKRSVCGDQASDTRSESDCVSISSTTATAATVASERILEDATLTVDAHHHHHENMFEELDNQFNLDCSIENIQREYVAYEEASKNETQLEHNYYANAMKSCVDEECVVINDTYGLRAIISMLGEPLENGAEVEQHLIAVSPVGNRKRKCSNAFEVISAEDVYLNGCEDEEKDTKRNGFVDRGATVFNGKRDLILNTDALMSSVQSATTPATKMARTTNGSSSKNFKNFKSKEVKRNATHDGFDNVNTLPFKSVKSSSAKTQWGLKQKRKYRRRSSTSTLFDDTNTEHSEISGVNGVLCDEDNLVEEIIVDEIS